MHHLIQEAGFDAYYSRKSGISAPVLDAPFAVLDWSWLQTRTEDGGEARFGITGVACEGCVWLVRQVAEQHEAIQSIHVDASNHTIHLVWKPGADLPALAKDWQRFGFLLERSPPSEQLKPPSRIPLVFSAVFAANAILFQMPRMLGIEQFSLTTLFDLLTALLAGMSLVMASHYFTRFRAYKACLKS